MSGLNRDSKKNKAPDPLRNKIKTTFCATCLSRDRQLHPIEGLNFDEFCADIPLAEDEDRVCWECKAIAVKMNEFRYKACKAQAILQNMIRRKKCDMSIHSLSELKVVNRSEHIIIGYEVDTDGTEPNTQATNIQISIDFPKREVDYTEPDNPLSPDDDYMDSIESIETDDMQKPAKKLKTSRSFVPCEQVEVDSNTVLKDASRPKRSIKQRSYESDSEDDEDRRISARKRKPRDDDDDNCGAAGPSSSEISSPSRNQPDSELLTDALNTLVTLKTAQSEPGGWNDRNDSMYKILEKMTAKLLTASKDNRDTLSPKKVINVKPIDSVEELNHLEKQLKYPEFEAKKRKDLSIFCNVGVGTGPNNAYEIIDRLFSRTFLTKCSWAGGSRSDTPKVCFKTYVRVIELFFNVVHDADPSMTLQTLEAFLKNVLRNSVKRSMCRRMKKSVTKCRRNKKNLLSGENLELLLEQATQAAENAEVEGIEQEEMPMRRERANSVC